MLLANSFDILSPLVSVITVNVQPSTDWHCRLDSDAVTLVAAVQRLTRTCDAWWSVAVCMTSQMTYELREMTSAGRRTSLGEKRLSVSAQRDKTPDNDLVLAPSPTLHVCIIHTLCCNLSNRVNTLSVVTLWLQLRHCVTAIQARVIAVSYVEP